MKDLLMTYICVVAVMSIAAFAEPAARHATPATQPDALTAEQMRELAAKAARKEAAEAKVGPVASKNMHLGEWELTSPLPEWRFYCATLPEAAPLPRKAGPPLPRRYIAVSQSGKIVMPFDAKQFGDLAAIADKRQWKNEDYLNAACLYVHLTTPASQDGWKLLAKPDDFTAIKFNMAAVGPGVDKQKEAAQQIKAPVVQRPKAETPSVMVNFYAWHLIGGYLREWEITFATRIHARQIELGQFGGGGYD